MLLFVQIHGGLEFLSIEPWYDVEVIRTLGRVPSDVIGSTCHITSWDDFHAAKVIDIH